MTSTIRNDLQYAEMAQATYSNLNSSMNVNTYIEALQVESGAGMSSEQATQFARAYTILDQKPNTSSGFSARGMMLSNPRTMKITISLGRNGSEAVISTAITLCYSIRTMVTITSYIAMRVPVSKIRDARRGRAVGHPRFERTRGGCDGERTQRWRNSCAAGACLSRPGCPEHQRFRIAGWADEIDARHAGRSGDTSGPALGNRISIVTHTKSRPRGGARTLICEIFHK